MRNKFIAIIIIFLGGGVLGIHKFYLGENFAGIMYFIFSWTFIPAILSFFDFLGLLLMSDAVFDAKYNGIVSQLPSKQAQQLSITSSERLDVQILKICNSKPEGATLSECVIFTGKDPQEVKKMIKHLCKEDLLIVDNRPGDHAVVYKTI